MNTKEEAMAKGVGVEETKHSMKRRASMHDYSNRGTYMLTLVVDDRRPLLGVLHGEGGENGNPDAEAWVEPSPLGEQIAKEEVLKIHRLYPQVEVWKLCVMPDHLHIIVRVKEDLPEGVHLGRVVRGFKAGCSKAWWGLEARPSVEASGTMAQARGKAQGGKLSASGTEAQARGKAQGGKLSASGTEAQEGNSGAKVPCPSRQGLSQGQGEKQPLFEKGYNDKILCRAGQLDNWKAYLDDNPRRLWLKRRNPQFFTALYDFLLAGRRCQIIGNRFLLDIPDKRAVIVHRRYSDEENARLRAEWLACGERGGVLVSAAIAPKEKTVMREAMDRGYRIILLRENGFPPLYKPSGEAFDACSEGRLLQISPWEYHMERTTITREQCLELNAIAEEIAGEK